MPRLIPLACFIFFAITLAALDIKALANANFGNDAPWYQDRIPFFESGDADLTKVYYYRWKIFRAHQRDLGAYGFISTEFLNDVGWQTNPWASLNDATGFHIQEGRWCRDRRFKEDYANFMFSSDSQTRQFSESMAAAVWQGYLVDGAAADAIAKLDAMKRVYEAWSDSFDSSKGLYWVEPLRDASEYTISSIDTTNGLDGFTGGNSFRPSINSYQFANAKAIASLAELQGDAQDVVETYNQKASSLKSIVQDKLWNSTFEHFIDRFQVNNSFVRYWDFIRGRELVGFVPWTHDLPDDHLDFAQAWKHILITSQLAGPHGLRTVEPSYQYYMRQYRYEGTNPECQWNGPVWPFQTTQVLTGLANFLDHYPAGVKSAVIGRTDYTKLLQQYAKLHYNPKRGGILDLEEDYYPDSGVPIVGLKRSPHYFHSGYIDLIMTGLVGIRPSDEDILEVNPVADGSIVTYFRVEHVLYHGHDVAVQWDVDGSHYGTLGLQVEIDGEIVASSSTLKRLIVPISRIAPPTISRPVAKSIQLSTTITFPKGSVSTPNVSATEIQSAIDGRIFFFPESDVANGWNTPPGNGSELWFEIDFGGNTTVQRAEIAFFADESQGFDVPKSYHVKAMDSSGWVELAETVYAEPIANGITLASWKTRSTEKVRLLFGPKDGSKVRLVEFKVF